jgi:hypothetical protein
MSWINIRIWVLWKLAVAMAFMGFVHKSEAQTLQKEPETFSVQHKAYMTHFAKDHPVIDGKITDAVWQQAAWTDYFLDIEGARKPAPSWKTRVKMLWNDSCLFVAAFLEEPHVWASLQQHDAIVYHDNDFEIFIDPDNDTHQYFEIEVNAWNTIFDLFMPKPYRNGGQAFIPFEVAGLQSAVHVQGTLNNPSDRDSGWTVEMAVPFRSLTFGNIWKAPEEGGIWRINFSRVQWDTEVIDGKYRKKKNNQGRFLPEHNWVWSPQGIINMHYPERWGYLQFTRNAEAAKSFSLPYHEKQKQNLWSIYYRQKEYFSKNKKYAQTLKDLKWDQPLINVEGVQNKMKLEATTRQFTAYIHDDQDGWSINDEGLVKQVKQSP